MERFDQGAIAELLAHINVSEDVDHSSAGEVDHQIEVVLPGPVDSSSLELVPDISGIDRPAADPMDRSDQKVKGVRRQQPKDRVDRVREKIDLEAEFDRQSPLLGAE